MKEMTLALPKLTAAQRKVMKWLGYGWEAHPGAGALLMVNGQSICTLSTMKALERSGYVEKDDQSCWRTTASGRSVTGRLCL